MADRLNGVIKQLEAGKHAHVCFAQPDRESALALSGSDYDGIVFEMEHNPWDIAALRDGLQWMLNRGQILKSGTLAPQVTPIVRIPPNGGEQNQWVAKQALDLGVYGIVWPHISTVEQAYNAVGACRYPRLKDKPIYEPAGIRGDAPGSAARYWGITNQEYYKKADVWPLAPEGEILCILMIEDTVGIANLPDILKNVPGIGLILIGEGDLSQELGVPRQYMHPTVVEAMDQVVATCKQYGVAVGHPHVDTENIGWIVEKGYRFLMTSPGRSYGALDKARQLTGRA
jgi:4-hydroxy-2-oxoheptanedioate aldolase